MTVKILSVPRLLALCALSLLLGLTYVWGGAEVHADASETGGEGSTSIGGPTNGELKGGVALPDRSRGLRRNPRQPNAEGRYGTEELVRALRYAARVVDQTMPGSEVVINDLSLPEGGPIPHHGSHQSGRDVDVLFYLLTEAGEPFPSKGIPIDPDGRGHDYGDLTTPADDVPVRIDIPRTWRFLQALAENPDPDARMQRVFVVEHVREMLMKHAEAISAPKAARDRVGLVTCQPNVPHDDHLHIRFFCSAEDIRAGCGDSFPIYPFRRAELRRQGVKPQLAKRLKRPKRPRAPTVSRPDAARRAGPMHEDVRAFLQRRESWSEAPRVGRPYCP